MFEAQYLFSGDNVYSPWMSRGGNNIIIQADLIDITGGTFSIEPQTRNSEDVADTSLGTALTMTAVGQGHKEYDDVKELVRYKFSLSGTSERVLFRMLSPVWFDDVLAGS